MPEPLAIQVHFRHVEDAGRNYGGEQRGALPVAIPTMFLECILDHEWVTAIGSCVADVRTRGC